MKCILTRVIKFRRFFEILILNNSQQPLHFITGVSVFWGFLEICFGLSTRNPHHTITGVIEGSSYVVSQSFSSILDASRLESDSNEEKQNSKKPFNNSRLFLKKWQGKHEIIEITCGYLTYFYSHFNVFEKNFGAKISLYFKNLARYSSPKIGGLFFFEQSRRQNLV